VVVIENNPPVAMEDTILTRIGQEVVFSPTANDLDPENDDFYIIEISQPNNGYVQLLTPQQCHIHPTPGIRALTHSHIPYGTQWVPPHVHSDHLRQ